MEFLKVCVVVCCVSGLLTVSESKEISKAEQRAEDGFWKDMLNPQFPTKSKSHSEDSKKPNVKHGVKHGVKSGVKSGVNPLALATVPINTAVYRGVNVTLLCSAVPGSGYRVQWWEFAHSDNGALISDNGQIDSGHPESARYTIVQPTPDTFNLHIRDVKWADAGMYVCQDVNSGPPDTYLGGIELIVIDDFPNCTTTLSPNGVVIEGQYYTAECTISFNGAIVPVQTWTGPPPFNVAESGGENDRWSGIGWTANRTMDTQTFRCINNFTDNFSPADGMSAHVPDWYFLYQTYQMFVFWGPKNMYAQPIKEVYEVGDIITCFADAFPAPNYLWHNTRTNDLYPTQGIILDASFAGTTQIMRCEATNEIQGFTYTDNLFINVTVLEESTSTGPPNLGFCTDLTGRWESAAEIPATLCLDVDNTANGYTIGILRNDTDTFWIEVVGRTTPGVYDIIGFTGIWPPPVGVSGFVGECHMCDGMESLLVNDIERFRGVQQCGFSDVIRYSPQYHFYRVSDSCV